MAITFINYVTNPSDNGTASGVLSVTPPSMNNGDFVLLLSQDENNSGGSLPVTYISNMGGQTWTSQISQIETDTIITALFSCVYNGSWSANPEVTASGSCHTLIMLVFRPTSTNYKLRVDNDYYVQTFSTPGIGVDTIISASGFPTKSNNTFSIGLWLVKTKPTWSSVSGSGWVDITDTQIRNNAGGTQCLGLSYNIQSSPTSLNDASKTMGALNKGSGYTLFMTFKEEKTSVNIIGNCKIFGNVKIL